MDEDNHEAYFNLGAVTFEKEYSFLADMHRSEDDVKTALKYYKLAHQEDPSQPRFYYQICALIDQTSKEAKVKWENYENFIKKYGTKQPYLSDFVAKRISELKKKYISLPINF